MEALSKKRSAAKGKVTYYINLLAPLLPLRAEEALSKAVETEDFYRKLLSAIETFKNAHKVYAEALENATDEDHWGSGGACKPVNMKSPYKDEW